MDPREQFERMQKQLAARGRGMFPGGGGPGGGPAIRSLLGVAGLIAGGIFLSNSLYNGEQDDYLFQI